MMGFGKLVGCSRRPVAVEGACEFNRQCGELSVTGNRLRERMLQERRSRRRDPAASVEVIPQCGRLGEPSAPLDNSNLTKLPAPPSAQKVIELRPILPSWQERYPRPADRQAVPDPAPISSRARPPPILQSPGAISLQSPVRAPHPAIRPGPGWQEAAGQSRRDRQDIGQMNGLRPIRGNAAYAPTFRIRSGPPRRLGCRR